MSYVDEAIEDAKIRAETAARGAPSRPRSVSAGELVAWFATGTRPGDDDPDGVALWGVAEVLTRQSVQLGELLHETPLAALRRTIPRRRDGRPAPVGGRTWADDDTSVLLDGDAEEVRMWYPGPIIESDDGTHWTNALACIVDACERSKRVTGPDEWRGEHKPAKEAR